MNSDKMCTNQESNRPLHFLSDSTSKITMVFLGSSPCVFLLWISVLLLLASVHGSSSSLSNEGIFGSSSPSIRRRACGLYLWDAPSAFFHAWCSRLMKD